MSRSRDSDVTEAVESDGRVGADVSARSVRVTVVLEGNELPAAARPGVALARPKLVPVVAALSVAVLGDEDVAVARGDVADVDATSHLSRSPGTKSA